MLNDPLIPTPPATAEAFPGAPMDEGQVRARAARVPQRAPRAKHPALSARILATGLAATGMFGMTAGYALGQRADDAAPVIDTGPSGTTPGDVATAPGAPSPQATLPAAPPAEAPQQASPAPRVVQVPVDVPTAASPGSGAGSGNWAPAPTQQQSNGSN